jgi:hypothetical protein
VVEDTRRLLSTSTIDAHSGRTYTSAVVVQVMLQQGSGFRLGFQGSGLQNPRVHITPIEGNAPLEGIDSTIKFALPGVYPALWNGEAVNLLIATDLRYL